MTVIDDRHIEGREFAVEDISTGIFASGYGQVGDGRSFSFHIEHRSLVVEIYRPRLADPVPQAEDVVARYATRSRARCRCPASHAPSPPACTRYGRRRGWGFGDVLVLGCRRMTVILLRHGRSTSNTAGILAGRSEGVDLDDKGREQAAGLIDRIGDLPIRAVVTSPLLRCRRTVEPLAEALCVEPLIDDRLAEVDYGEWTGRKIGELMNEPLWRVVQAHPSAAVFPGGEGLAEVQARAVPVSR